MGFLPSEELLKQSQAEQEPKEMVLEKPIALALGRGLKQIFNESGTETISTTLESLSKIGERRDTVKTMQDSLAFLLEIVNKLQISKEVKLTQEKKGGQWDFKFSPEKDPTEKYQAGELIIDKDLSEKLMSAIGNNFGNKIAGLTGFSELIGGTSNDISVKENAGLINKHAWEIHKNVSSATKAGSGIRLFTNDGGKTTISPISQELTPLHS